MKLRQAAFTAAGTTAALLALTGCTGTNQTVQPPHTAKATPTTVAYEVPSASGELVRIVVDGPSSAAERQATIGSSASDSLVQAACTGPTKPLGFQLYEDGALVTSGSVPCDGLPHADTAFTSVSGKHRAKLVRTGFVTKKTRAYAVLAPPQ